MTQPPSPSAAALESRLRLGVVASDAAKEAVHIWRRIGRNGFNAIAQLCDAFAAQAVAAATAYPEPYPQLDYEGAAAARGDELPAAERAKPAASDLDEETLREVLSSMEIHCHWGCWANQGGKPCDACEQKSPEFYKARGVLIAALAERGEREREACAPEDPTPAMIEHGVTVHRTPRTGPDETLVHDIWQAMHDEWRNQTLTEKDAQSTK